MLIEGFPTDWRYYVRAGFVCFLASLFYLYDFVLQVAPSVITHDLMGELGLGATGLGIMSAFFFYAYAPMQLPAGLSYDKFSPRFILALATTVCALGGLFFSMGHTMLTLCLGRFLTGAGAAFSFIGTLVLITHWFPARYFGILAGVVQFMSCLGSILGQAPLANAVQSAGWRHSIFTISCIGFGLAVLILLCVRDYPAHQQHVRSATPKVSRGIYGLWSVLKRSHTWAIGLYSLIIWTPAVVFAELWGVPYLMQAYHYSASTVSSLLVCYWLGMGIGSPLAGYVSNLLKVRKAVLSGCLILGFVSICMLLYGPALSYVGLSIWLFIFGLAASGQSFAFAVVQDRNSPETVGTAIGLNNMFVVVSGALFQPIASMLLSFFWDGTRAQGVPIFSTQNYQIAMSILPVIFVLGWFIVRYWLKETFTSEIAAKEKSLVAVPEM
ncbi:MAG: MFS transporter [Gammaproteobacteria bacterium]|nr:MFS transporter [Gammaproteobacteria bacterium]